MVALPTTVLGHCMCTHMSITGYTWTSCVTYVADQSGSACITHV